MPGWPAVTRRWCGPRGGCSARRSRCAGTGRSRGRTSLPAAGRSSSPTSTTPMWTTRPRGCSRSSAWPARCRSPGSRAPGSGPSSGPSADVTAHTIEMLAAVGRSARPASRAGVRWLPDHQEADGSWFGRWGINYIYGTGAAVPGLIAAGQDPASEPIRRAVRWLERHQNEDGGWGEDARSYDDPRWIGRGPSTASQTAWALLALHAAGEQSEALARGVAWLTATQRPDGGWDEPQYTRTGVPSDYYINYHLHRISFPLMAP